MPFTFDQSSCYTHTISSLQQSNSPDSKNSQKPASELYAAFKQNFPHVGPGTTSTASSETSTKSTTSLSSISVNQVMDQRCDDNLIRNFEKFEIVTFREALFTGSCPCSVHTSLGGFLINISWKMRLTTTLLQTIWRSGWQNRS